MTAAQPDSHTARLGDERLIRAVDDLKGLILACEPTATFSVGRGQDPEGLYVYAIVDREDLDHVWDACRDRLLEIRADERLSVYVIPTQPPPP
jgi:hypothetical protein